MRDDEENFSVKLLTDITQYSEAQSEFSLSRLWDLATSDSGDELTS